LKGGGSEQFASLFISNMAIIILFIPKWFAAWEPVGQRRRFFLTIIWMQSLIKKRIISFIDGFNLYHAICDLKQNHLKWVNLRSLSEAFIKPSQEELIAVYFFSAYATWKEQSHLRHIKYVQALEAVGVTTVLGHFKEKKRKCRECKNEYTAHEEKETDVNIAIKLLDLAHRKAFDKAFIITADSDLCPVINLITDNFKDIEILILVPPNRYKIARELRNNVSTVKIKQGHIENNLFSEKVINENDGKVIKIPKEYRKKHANNCEVELF
jgi:uncharacterized LabA/DUF88 family protein